MGNEKKKSFEHLAVSKETHQTIKELAGEQGKKMYSIVDEAIAEYLKKIKKFH